MALTKVNRGGLNTGISDSSDATFLTVDSSEQAVIKSEGGAVTTSVQQGLSKAYASVNGQSTAATRGTFNMSSLTDNGTGNYTLGITNDMADTNYTGQLSGGDHSGADDSFSRHYIYSLNTGNVSALIAATGSGSLYDATYFGFTIHGDLA